MPKRISKKQIGFAKDYIETGNGVQSALKNYDTKDYATANSIAVENLQKPSVIGLIEGFAKKAAENIQDLANNAENEAVRLNANKDQLDRAGYKPIERSMNVIVEVEPSERIKELARKLKELDA